MNRTKKKSRLAVCLSFNILREQNHANEINVTVLENNTNQQTSHCEELYAK